MKCLMASPSRCGSRVLVPCLVVVSFVYFLLFYCTTFDLFDDVTSSPFFEDGGQPEVGRSFAIRTSGCRIPDMDPFEPSVLNVTSGQPDPFQCPCVLWEGLTYVRGHDLRVNRDVVRRMGVDPDDVTSGQRFQCCVYFLFRNLTEDNDNFMRFPSDCIRFNVSIRASSEYMKVDCSLDGFRVYETFHHRFARKPEVESRCSQTKKEKKVEGWQPSVLLLFVDSVSRINFRRNMARSRDVLLQELGAVEMHGYNRVGDNTFPNLVPLLGGVPVSGLRDLCWSQEDGMRTFDNCSRSFLWGRFGASGYRTAFVEDLPDIGAFHFEKAGFRSAPTDYYAHNYFQEFYKLSMKQGDCLNGIPEPEVVLRMALELARLFADDEPFFGLFATNRFTHDDVSRARLMDHLLARYLRELKADRLLDNTFLFIFSDHGLRFGKFRDTVAGGYEVNLPALYVVVPPRFRSENPAATENLTLNSRRLTTPFDIHRTLLLLLPDSQDGRRPADEAYSLFESIPESRTCQEALVPPEFCACQESEEEHVDPGKAADAVRRLLLPRLNALTASSRGLCAELRLGSVVRAKEIRRRDKDRQLRSFLEVVFEVLPGKGIFQGTVANDIRPDEGSSDDTEITRIDRYGETSACVSHNSRLRQFCYCV